jgi:hypothetical protein
MSWTASETDSQNNPWGCYDEVASILAIWRRNNLFAQMNEDLLFSAVYLKGLHRNTIIRKELITETTKHIRDQLERSIDGDNTNMAVFQKIKELLANEKENRKFGNRDNSSDKKKEYKPYNGNNNNNYFKRKDTNTETAAAASEDTAAAADGSEGKLFPGEVFKDRKITCTDKLKRTQIYVAVIKKSKICDKCYPDSGAPTNACARPCFASQCSLCAYHGHNKYNCMQSHHASTGDKLSR